MPITYLPTTMGLVQPGTRRGMLDTTMGSLQGSSMTCELGVYVWGLGLGFS